MRYAFILAVAILAGCKDKPKPTDKIQTYRGFEFGYHANDTSSITLYPGSRGLESLPLDSNWQIVQKIESKDSTVYKLVYRKPVEQSKERYFFLHYTVTEVGGPGPCASGECEFHCKRMFNEGNIDSFILMSLPKEAKCYQQPNIDWFHEFASEEEYLLFTAGDRRTDKPVIKKKKPCCETNFETFDFGHGRMYVGDTDTIIYTTPQIGTTLDSI